MRFPELYRIRQSVPQEALDDIEGALEAEVTRTGLLDCIGQGSNVIIGVGSRGIPNYQTVIAKLVRLLRDRGASVRILPAMGSHGGGHGPGQVRVLAELGITPESVAAPIIETAEVVSVGETPSGIPVYADRAVTEADGVILANRVKEHTEFHGSIQSGLLKMMAIGLGRYQGAVTVHEYAVKLGYEQAIREVSRRYMAELPILGGIAFVDGPDNKTARLEAILPPDIEAAERRLLGLARQLTPTLPLDVLDMLIVDEMGKNISGTGLDTKVIGRIMNIYEAELTRPRITRILVRDLTPETGGNALGVGLADYTTQRLVDKIDFEVTNLNAVAAIAPEKARIPITLPNDKEALTTALHTIGPWDEESIRLLWIRNTSSLVELMASSAACAAIDPARIASVEGPVPTRFDDEGNLLSPWADGSQTPPASGLAVNRG
jgi:hypothetical protein